MQFPLSCPRCQMVLQVTAADAGKSIACGNCGQPIVVPSAPGAPYGQAPMPYPAPAQGSSAIWWVLGIIVAGLLLVCAGGGAGYFFLARIGAQRFQSQNNAKQLMLGLLTYESKYKHLPTSATIDAGGKKLLSWRVELLPFIEQQGLYQAFHHDEPWDSPHNSKLISAMPDTFASPGLGIPPGKTCWQAVAGPGAIIADPFEFPGRAFKGISIAMIKDGTTNTIAIVEVNPDQAVEWTKPDDFEYDPADPIRGLGTARSGEFIAGFGDGSVGAVSASADPEMLRRVFDRADGKVIDRSKLNGR